MEDFFGRLDKFMAFKKLNDNKITVITGISVGSIGKQRKGSRGLSNESIAKILNSFPELDADWLLTGRGEMLKSRQTVGDVSNSGSGNVAIGNIQGDGHSITNQGIQDCHIKQIFEENRRLTNELIKKDEKINSLVDRINLLTDKLLNI
jgi:hypothetical protein